jgi:TPR repeat protein
MAAASSSGTNQQLTLDHSSFEKLLAAAWVLQCLHDQLHRPADGGKASAQPVTPWGKIERGSSVSLEITRRKIIKPAIQLSPIVIEATGKASALNTRSSEDQTLTERVKTHEAIETGILKLDATVKRLVSLSPKLTHEPGTRKLTPVELRPAELSPVVRTPLRLAPLALQPKPPAEPELIKPAPVQRKPPDQDKPAPRASSFDPGTSLNRLRGILTHYVSTGRAKAALRTLRTITATHVSLRNTVTRFRDSFAHYQAAFRVRIEKELASRGSSSNLEAALKRVRDACALRTPTFRINFTLRSLRAVAIATPVWLLVVIANLLLLETWLHQPFQGARAMSAPSPTIAEAAVTANLSALAHSTRPLSQPTKRIESTEPRQPTSIPPFAASHDQITDPATSSVVAQLSRFEISGLRRQAKYGDESAAFTLGMAYEVGHYVRQNCAEAARWVRMAAEAGSPAAEYNLGLRYRDGDGVSADLHESEKWLRKAAAHRNRNARLALQLLASR